MAMNRRDLFKLVGLGLIATVAPKLVQAKMVDATSRLYLHPSMPKAWAKINSSAAIIDGYNVTAITDKSPEHATINFARPMRSNEYICMVVYGQN